MGEFEKQHPLMSAVSKTFSELFVHKKEELMRQALLKKVSVMNTNPAFTESKR